MNSTNGLLFLRHHVMM